MGAVSLSSSSTRSSVAIIYIYHFITQGASKGMTTITNVVKERHDHNIEQFLVMGPSKVRIVFVKMVTIYNFYTSCM